MLGIALDDLIKGLEHVVSHWRVARVIVSKWVLIEPFHDY